MNWLFFPTLLFAVFFLILNLVIWKKIDRFHLKIVNLTGSVLISLPGFLFPTYYLHFFDNSKWFYHFRSLPYSELSASGLGFLFGIIFAQFERKDFSFRISSFLLFSGLIFIPYLKPIIGPLDPNIFQNRWADGICIQSTPSSCGPACTATILKSFGIEVSEAQIAKECFTYQGGTENWYLARFFRKFGFEVEFITGFFPDEKIPIPSIAGIKINGIGHFVPFIAQTPTKLITGDPLIGKQEWPKVSINKEFKFTGFFLKILRRT